MLALAQCLKQRFRVAHDAPGIDLEWLPCHFFIQDADKFLDRRLQIIPFLKARLAKRLSLANGISIGVGRELVTGRLDFLSKLLHALMRSASDRDRTILKRFR